MGWIIVKVFKSDTKAQHLNRRKQRASVKEHENIIHIWKPSLRSTVFNFNKVVNKQKLLVTEVGKCFENYSAFLTGTTHTNFNFFSVNWRANELSVSFETKYVFTCSWSTMETSEQCVQHVQSSQYRHENDVKKMAMKSLRKINTKLQFLYRQNKFLNPKLRRLLCNSLIQAHFDYTCISWYPLINQKKRNKLHVTQNKCICFCLKLNSRQHIGAKEFKDNTGFKDNTRITLGHIWLWRYLWKK